MKGCINEWFNQLVGSIESIKNPYCKGIMIGISNGFFELPEFNIEALRTGLQVYGYIKHGGERSAIRFDEPYTLTAKAIQKSPLKEEEAYGFCLGTALGVTGAIALGFKPWGVGAGIDIANWVERTYRQSVEEDELRRDEVNPDVWKLP